MTGYTTVDIKRRFFELNHDSINDWFDRYELLAKDIPPADRWNADKVGVRIGIVQGGRVKVVVLREVLNQKVRIPSCLNQCYYVLIPFISPRFMTSPTASLVP